MEQHKLSLPQAKAWSRANLHLALDCLKLRAIAELTRKEVDAYLQPVFETFEFFDDEGKRITKPRDLYLCEDEALCRRYYDACDAARRVHGFTGPKDHCPALIAENAQLAAECRLIDSGATMTGINRNIIWGANRAELLRILIGLCLSVDKKASSANPGHALVSGWSPATARQRVGGTYGS